MMARNGLLLNALTETYAVVHLPLDSSLSLACPESEGLWSVTRTHLEYSLVCRESLAELYASQSSRADLGWRAFYLQGPIPFDQTGVIASLTGPLAAAGLGCFLISTFDSDVIMIKSIDCHAALLAWKQAGIAVAEQES